MPRRIVDSEPSYHERWVISYADFITLMFAFFVVMYSISSVNEGKYRMLSKTLEQVFVDPSEQIVDPKEGEPAFADSAIEFPTPGNYNAMEQVEFGIEGDQQNIEAGGAQGVEEALPFEPRLDAIQEQIAAQFNDLVERGEVSVTGNRNWIAIDINSNFLFASGRAEPSEMAEEIIGGVAEILLAYNDPVHVEGFTDNVPIHTQAFPSNWELSSARAAAIVRLMAYNRIDPKRMAAIGYGEYHPIASNESEEGRSKNRRVSIVMSKKGTVRHSAADRLNDKEALLDAMQLDVLEQELLQQGIESLESDGAETETAEASAEQSSTARSPEKDSPPPVKTIPLGNGGLLFTN